MNKNNSVSTTRDLFDEAMAVVIRDRVAHMKIRGDQAIRRELGISPSALSHITAGRERVGPDRGRQLAKGLGWEYSQLVAAAEAKARELSEYRARQDVLNRAHQHAAASVKKGNGSTEQDSHVSADVQASALAIDLAATLIAALTEWIEAQSGGQAARPGAAPAERAARARVGRG